MKRKKIIFSPDNFHCLTLQIYSNFRVASRQASRQVGRRACSGRTTSYLHIRFHSSRQSVKTLKLSLSNKKTYFSSLPRHILDQEIWCHVNSLKNVSRNNNCPLQYSPFPREKMLDKKVEQFPIKVAQEVATAKFT